MHYIERMLMMFYIKLVVGALMIVLPMKSLASEDKSSLEEIAKFSYVASISLGGAWAQGGQQQQFYLLQNLQQTFTANRPNSHLGDGEIFFGVEQYIVRRIKAQLGVAYVVTGPVNFNGDIWDESDPAFNNYVYQYKVSHQHGAIKLKLLQDIINCRVHPYVSGSMGIGYNKSYGYTNTPTIPEAITNPNFTNKTVSDFTYTLGLGAQYDIDNHFSAGFGYEFGSWGKSQLGRTPSQSVNNGLTSNNLYTNQLLVNLTFVS